MSKIIYGGWAVDSYLVDTIYRILPAGSTVLELGSGDGSTPALCRRYRVYSVEDNPEWLYKYSSEYIYAPSKKHKEIKNHLGNQWYDPNVLRERLQGIEYDLLLVDGPATGRSGFLKYLDLFKLDIPIVLDDLHRFRDYKIAISLSHRIRRPFTVYANHEGKAFGVFE